jgi:hypothetical protein
MAKGKGNGAGRPTNMTENTVNKLEYAFSIGCTDLQACIYAGISKQTLYNYQDKTPGFVDRKQLLKENPVLLAKENVMLALKEKNISISTWLLERRDDDFKPKSKHEVEIGAHKSLIDAIIAAKKGEK